MNQSQQRNMYQHRALDMRNPLEMSIAGLFGARMRESKEFCEDVWSSFTMTIWVHKDHGEKNFSVVGASDMIAAVREDGCYLDWIACARRAVISEEVSEGMLAAGWTLARKKKFV